MFRALISLLVLLCGCPLFSMPPATDPPARCSSAQHVWDGFHLAHDALSPVVTNDTGYTPDLESWNELGTVVQLRDGGEGFPLYVRLGGNASSEWLGLASVSVQKSTGHIRFAEVQMNWTILQRYSPVVGRHVLCQELGHLLGLDHQPNTALTSCMNDCVGLRGVDWLACLEDPRGVTPDAHDAEQLREIYAHVGAPEPPPPPSCDGEGATSFVVHAFPLEGNGHH